MICSPCQAPKKPRTRKSTPTKAPTIADNVPGYIVKFEFGSLVGDIIKSVNYVEIPAYCRKTPINTRLGKRAKSADSLVTSTVGGRELRRKKRSSIAWSNNSE